MIARDVARLAGAASVGSALLTLYLTLSPEVPGEGIVPDSVGHLVAFFTVAMTAGVHRATLMSRRDARWYLGVLLGFALFTEVGQGVTGRDPSLADFAVDAVGIALGLGLGHVVGRRVPRPPREG